MLLDFKDDKYKRKILCFYHNAFVLDLFYTLAGNNQDTLFIFLTNISDAHDTFYRHKASELKNVIRADLKELADVVLKLKSVGLLITSAAQSDRLCKDGLKVVALCNQSKIPVFEIQHGMFQHGIHYQSGEQELSNESLTAETYADRILTYYPAGMENEIVIGYPAFNNQAKAIAGDYTLVLSNLHWQTYQKLNVYKFYHAVIKYAAKHPEQIFMWQPHPGEMANGGLNHLLLKSLFGIYPKARRNFINIKENPVSNLVPTSEWIRKAGRVISTISTVLLECEMYQKPTLIWECEDTKVLLDKIKTKASFKDYADLCRMNDLPDEALQLKSGLLLPYDNDAFRRAVAAHYHGPAESDRNLLADVLKYL